MAEKKTYRVAWLPGDGIGPEVTREAIRVMEVAAEAHGFAVAFDEHLVGGAALDAEGDPLPPATQQACVQADAVLLGAVGGPRWDDAVGDQRPESGLLRLRRLLGAYANLRPVSVPAGLAGSSPLREDLVAGTDLLIVRELTGGIYFGEPRGRRVEEGQVVAFNTMHYSEEEIARIARVAFRWAEKRNGRVTSVDKANVLVVSQLWRDVVSEVHREEFAHVELNHLYVDNAAMQLVRQPRQFDVVLTSNLFGDILSDLAATLPGSLGLLPSASLGGRVELFEPVHGSAPDIAGEGKANPLAAVLSGAMLFEALGETTAAQAIRNAVAAALDAGYRTTDIWAEGRQCVTTTEMGHYIASHIAEGTREVVA